jgi:PIN domain nuclease of toxin-antitoxin system
MTLLLDTHVFLWWIVDSGKLSDAARNAIETAENRILLSATSVWEIVIKTRLGKLRLPESPGPFVQAHLKRNGFLPLPIALEHAVAVAELPDHHRDPFDRMLVAQCKVENCSIITADSIIVKYDVPTVW